VGALHAAHSRVSEPLSPRGVCGSLLVAASSAVAVRRFVPCGLDANSAPDTGNPPGEMAAPTPRRLVLVMYYGTGCCEPPHALRPASDAPSEPRLNVIGIAAAALRAAGVDVLCVPDRVDPASNVHAIPAAIRQHGASACLWWDCVVTAEELEAIRAATPGVVHALFSWDPTRNAFAGASDAPKRHLFDVAFPTDADASVYTCPTRTLYVPVDTQKLFTPQPGTPRAFAVSFALTNYYRGYPHQAVCRYALCTALARHFGPAFGLFGPESLIAGEADDSPLRASYRGFIAYCDLGWLANASGVSMCLSADASVHAYVNERACVLAACGANVLMDHTSGVQSVFGADGDCVTYVEPGTDADAVCERVDAMLRSAEDDPATTQARRDNLRALAVARFDAAHWATGILEGLASVAPTQ
jgi:hypothetical protein